MSLNIIEAVFDDCVVTSTEAVFQYDYGQILIFPDLELPEAYEVHFSNERYNGSTVTQIGSADGVTVPDALLQTGKPVYAFVFLHDGEDDGETEYVVTIPVAKRPEISDDTPDPVEQSAISQAIAALNQAVQETGENVSLAAGYASEAEDYKDAAEDSAEDSEAWAVGKRGGTDVEETDETFHNNSKYYSEVAQQAAADAGYIQFYIDANGHLIYEKTSNVDLSFSLVDGHLYVEG